MNKVELSGFDNWNKLGRKPPTIKINDFELSNVTDVSFSASASSPIPTLAVSLFASETKVVVENCDVEFFVTDLSGKQFVIKGKLENFNKL